MSTIRELAETPMPSRIAALPCDRRGYPVPFFAAVVDGEPDLTLLDQRKQRACIEYRRCGICGQQVDGDIAFITGPLGVENRVVTDPGMHEDCARYALAVCPFLARPSARRRATQRPGSIPSPGAVMERPERTALYLTRHYVPRRVEQSILIRLWPATRIEWFEDASVAAR